MRDFSPIEKSIRERMLDHKIHEIVIDEFLRRVRAVNDGATGKITWKEIANLDKSDTLDLEELPKANLSIDDYKKLCMIKLNGGLGTTMGLSQAKSLIQVKGDLTFLDIVREQTQLLRKKTGAPLPLLFMNSFNTQEDTLAYPGIRNINESIGLPADFLQNMVPRIFAESLLPIGDGKDSAHWTPPGHGDIYFALQITGLLDKLLSQGFTVAFLSNGDNLGATFNGEIFQYMLKNDVDFLMEATPKTKADLKGGVLFKHKTNNRIELLETAQVEEDHLADFQDVERFSHFSINNIWLKLPELKKMMLDHLHLSLIVNPKEYEGKKILQLETAMGSAVGQFSKSKVVYVPRNRFSPVKNTADLIVRRSDCYVIREDDFALVKNPHRSLDEPVVTLDEKYYKKVQDCDQRIGVVPSLLNCTSLRVEGSVIFDVPVEISGDVSIRANGERKISSLQKNILENAVFHFD